MQQQADSSPQTPLVPQHRPGKLPGSYQSGPPQQSPTSTKQVSIQQHSPTQHQPHYPQKASKNQSKPVKVTSPHQRPWKPLEGKSTVKRPVTNLYLQSVRERYLTSQQAVANQLQHRTVQGEQPQLNALLLSLKHLDLTRYRPHELLDKMTVLYNAAYKPKKALIFDHCLMAGLVFYRGYILLSQDPSLATGGEQPRRPVPFKPPHTAYNANALPWTLEPTVHDLIFSNISDRTGFAPGALQLFLAPQVHRPLKLDISHLGLSVFVPSHPTAVGLGSTAQTHQHQQHQQQREQPVSVDTWFCAQLYELVWPAQAIPQLTALLSARLCRWFDEKEIRESADVADEWKKFLLLTFERRREVVRAVRRQDEQALALARAKEQEQQQQQQQQQAKAQMLADREMQVHVIAQTQADREIQRGEKRKREESDDP
ncbi:hypothetical protein MBLNU459_g3987t1 [Dothideomycetes sp. NU459]